MHRRGSSARPAADRRAPARARRRGRDHRARVRADGRHPRTARSRPRGDRRPRRRRRRPARASRSHAAAGRWPRGLGRGASTSRSATARSTSRSSRRCCGSPSAQMQDYEFAGLQRQLAFRAARRVLAPDAIGVEAMRRAGAAERKLVRYPGLKEDYYLADFEPDAAVLDELGIDREAVLAVVRPPPETSAYHERNPVYDAVLDRLAADERAVAVVIPRTEAQADAVRARSEPSLIVPERAIDAQSLIAYADLVVSAGGTMNREAVALGTPVYTIFSGRMGAVDERLIAAGLLRPLASAGGARAGQARLGARAAPPPRPAAARRRHPRSGGVADVRRRAPGDDPGAVRLPGRRRARLAAGPGCRADRLADRGDRLPERRAACTPTRRRSSAAWRSSSAPASPRSSSCPGPSRPRRCSSAPW